MRRPKSNRSSSSILAGSCICFGKIESGKRVVDLVIQRQRGLGCRGLGEHGSGVVSKGRVWMHLLHQRGEITAGVDLSDRLVEGDESVFDGARAFDSDEDIDGTLGRCQPLAYGFFKGWNIGL